VHKKTGKPVMFRSQMLTKKKVTDDQGVRKTDEDQELAAFLARDA
jgi:hypothetical protein